MNKIGQGLQFNVYEYKNRVIKIPTSKLQIKLKLILWHPLYLFHPLKLEKEANKIIQQRSITIQKIQKHTIPRSLLANPDFKNNIIMQDKVIIIKETLSKNPNSKKIIDKYINFIQNSWKHGFSEKTYNFTINHGINSENHIVLIDFGEITFNKSDIIQDIKTKRWTKSWTFKKHLNKELKTYYNKQMTKHITINNLNRFWKNTNS